MRTRSLIEFLAFLAVCLGFGATIGAWCGCQPKDRIIQGAENADAVMQYERLLDDCKAKARAARDYDVFERCANDVDAMLCTVNLAFCNDGGRR